jgi:hypothetical protein
MVGSKVAAKSTTELIKVVFRNSLMKGTDITPQYRFDVSGA